MAKKPKFRNIARACLCILIAVVLFFVFYAYRMEVLQLTGNDQSTQIKISEKKLKKVQKKLAKYDINNFDDWSKITDVLDQDLNNFQVQLYFDNQQYLVSKNSPTLSKIFDAKYVQNYSIDMNGSTARLLTIPMFTEFFRIYAIISALLSLLLGFISYLILSHVYKKQLIRSISANIVALRPLHNLSTQLLVVNILAALIVLSFYSFSYANRYSYFGFLDEQINTKMDIPSRQELQHSIEGLTILSEDKQQVFQVIASQINKNTTVSIISKDGTYLLAIPNNYHPATLSKSKNNFFFSGDNLVKALSTPMMKQIPLRFQDATVTALVNYYPLIAYVDSYMIGIVVISVLLYIAILVCFIQYKVLLIKKMQQDINELASGGWQHKIHVEGKDEIAELGNNLNEMRLTFVENMESEQKLRESNKDLITSVSHDLKTPLTSLLGYLEIIKYKKNPSKNEEYLNKAIHKVLQIEDLSNQMFEYFLIYGQEEKAQLSNMSAKPLLSYIEENINFLIYEGYQIEKNVSVDPTLPLLLNTMLIHRAIDNICSNIKKYADKSQKIVILIEVDKGSLRLSFKNSIGIRDVKESNKIGLRSIEKIIKIHLGKLNIKQDEDSYIICLSLPVIQK